MRIKGRTIRSTPEAIYAFKSKFCEDCIGNFSSEVIYDLNDFCYYNGKIYKSLIDNNTNVPIDTSSWSELAAGGSAPGTNTFIVTQNTPTELPTKDVSVPDLTFQQCLDLITHYLNGDRCLVASAPIGAMEVIYAKGTQSPLTGELIISLHQNDNNYLVTYKGANNIIRISASDIVAKPFVLTGMSGYFDNDEEEFLLLHDNIVIDWSNPTTTPYYGSHHYLRKTEFTQNEERLIYEDNDIQCLIVPDVHMWQIIKKGPFKHKVTIYKNDSQHSLGISMEVIDNLSGSINNLARIPDSGVVPCKAKSVGTPTQSVLYYIQHLESYDCLYVKLPSETSADYWDTLDLVFDDEVIKL